MSNKANQESTCTNGTPNTFQSLQGTENRVGTQMHADTSVEQKAHDLCTLGASSPSCTPPAEQAAPKAVPGELHDHQILAITTAYEQGVGKGRQAYGSGKEIANPYDTGYRCDLAWQYGYKEGKEQAERIAKAAPQQEAQEPVAYVEVSQSDAEVSMTWGPEPAGFNLPTGRYALYTTPQPAPDCHHRPPCEECAALAAQGGKA